MNFGRKSQIKTRQFRILKRGQKPFRAGSLPKKTDPSRKKLENSHLLGATRWTGHRRILGQLKKGRVAQPTEIKG